MSLSNNVKQATALKYQLDKENSAPVVVASGMGVVAQKIVDVAVENNVPIFEDDSLSALLSQLSVGREIPTELFQAIVDIYVYFLNFTLDSSAPKAQPAQAQTQSAQTQSAQAAQAAPEPMYISSKQSNEEFFKENHVQEQFTPLQFDDGSDPDDFIPF